MHKHSTPCTTYLALIAEYSCVGVSDRHIHVSVVHDYVCRLPPKFKGDALEIVLVRVPHDLIAHLSRASECYLINIRVLGKRLASCRAIAR